MPDPGYAPYRLSGRIGGGILLPLVGALSAVVAAFAYAWLDLHSPVVGYVSILFVALLAAGTALPISWAARLVHCRSPAFLLGNAAFTGVLAVYLAWAFFAWMFLRRFAPGAGVGLVDAITSPAFLWDFARSLAAEGWYDLSGFRPQGVLLWFFWVGEAVAVLGLCLALARRGIADRAFCEDCGKWMVDEGAVSIPAQVGTLARDVRHHGLAVVTEVTPPSLKPDKWVRIDRARCPECGKNAVFRVSQAIHFRNKQGKEDVALRPLIPWSLQTEEVRAEIERIAGLLREADRRRFEEIKRQRAGPG